MYVYILYMDIYEFCKVNLNLITNLCKYLKSTHSFASNLYFHYLKVQLNSQGAIYSYRLITMQIF